MAHSTESNAVLWSTRQADVQRGAALCGASHIPLLTQHSTKLCFGCCFFFFGSDSMGKKKQMGYKDQRVLGLCEMGSEQMGLGVTGFI